jgi:hypothetical protein
MAKKISYTNRDFASIRNDLVQLTKDYYPDLIQNTNDASIFSVLLDLNSAVADNLHFHIDRVWQETMLNYAQKRISLYNIAKTYGLKIGGLKPSVALCDFSINVPVRGDKDDERYEGLLRRGVQVSGGGQIFETIDDIDFSSPFNSAGEPNRLKIPNFDNNNKLISYTITKRETVVNGVSKIFRKVISENDQKPFFKIYLPEQNVLNVVSIIHKDGTSFTTNPTNSEFYDDSDYRWYEVDSLIDDSVFIDSKVSPKSTKLGYNKLIDKKFVTEYTPEGYLNITFGSGVNNQLKNIDDYVNGVLPNSFTKLVQDSSILGEIPKVNTTLFIKYRVGGGKDSNIGVNVINSVDNSDFILNGPNININNQVNRSLRVTNVTPAIGGANQPSVEEIRNMISYNFSAQKRAVTLNDYKSLIENMPSRYGAPAKVNVYEVDNKISIKLLSYDENGNLTNNVSNYLIDNVLNYIEEYKMVNDYIEITNGEVIDLGLEIDIIIDKNANSNDVVKQIISESNLYFDINKRVMGQPFLVSDYNHVINQIAGVANIVETRVYNLIGGTYSSNQVLQSYVDDTTKQIKLNDMFVYMDSNQIFQIRYPNKDIKIRFKTPSIPTY